MIERARGTMLRLCLAAAGGNLGLEALHGEWPNGEDGMPLLQPFFDDVLDGVEHYPGKLTWRGVVGLPDVWRRLEMYRQLIADAVILETVPNLEQANGVRGEIAADMPPDIASLRSRLRALYTNRGWDVAAMEKAFARASEATEGTA